MMVVVVVLIMNVWLRWVDWQQLVNDLRANLTEARVEAAQTQKLKEDLVRAEAYISELVEKASHAEVEALSQLHVKEEVDEIRAALREKSRENRSVRQFLPVMQAVPRQFKT